LKAELRHLRAVARWGSLLSHARERLAYAAEKKILSSREARCAKDALPKALFEIARGQLETSELPHPCDEPAPDRIGLRLGEKQPKPDAEADCGPLDAFERLLDRLDQLASGPLGSRREQLAHVLEVVVERAARNPGGQDEVVDLWRIGPPLRKHAESGLQDTRLGACAALSPHTGAMIGLFASCLRPHARLGDFDTLIIFVKLTMQFSFAPPALSGDPTLVDGINSWSPKQVWSWLTSL
jgi:hypothetical protein